MMRIVSAVVFGVCTILLVQQGVAAVSGLFRAGDDERRGVGGGPS